MTEYSRVAMALAIMLLSTFSNHLLGDNPIVIQDIIQVQESCELDNGQITIIVEGNPPGLQYSIDGGLTYSNSNHFENLESKNYLIIVTDGSLCSEIYTAQIADSGYPELYLEAECVPGLNRSLIQPFFDGRSRPYSYDWSGPNGSSFTSENIPEAIPGTYQLIITDNLGCVFSDSITVSECCKLNLTCNLQDETFDCVNTVPEGNPLLTNPSTLESTKGNLLDALGISVQAGACGPLNVQIIDNANNPTDCENDTLRIYRDYIISDAHEEITCTQMLSVTNFVKAAITSEAADASISCQADVATEHQSWLANNGGLVFLACSDPITVSTIPVVPILDNSCGAENLVTFVVEDGCGNTIESSAIFKIVDDEKPSIICPDNLVLISTDTEVTTTVSDWLMTSSASDNCTDNPMISNDFNTDLSELCTILNPIEVTFIVTDLCSNTSNCISTIEVINTFPAITCPSDLIIDCGSGEAEDVFDQWLAEAEATQNNSNLVTNTFAGALNTIVCSEIQTVVFSTFDDCGNGVECSASVSIIDDEKPELNCPEEISFNARESGVSNRIQEWLDSATASDCNAVTHTHDFELDLESIKCSDAFPIVYTAEDFCGLTSSCNTTLNIVNDATIDITCPDAITLLCTDPHIYNEIAAHIDLVTVNSQDDYELLDDYDESLIDIACTTPSTIEIAMLAVDQCGKEVDCQTAINIIPDPIVYIPNLFSPDGDGIDDYFTAYANTSVAIIKSMTIYSRWGSKVFEQFDFLPNDGHAGWNGRYQNQKEKTEVFTYYFVFEDTQGAEMEKVGTVQILKQ